jgi:hypothetical protein
MPPEEPVRSEGLPRFAQDTLPEEEPAEAAPTEAAPTEAAPVPESEPGEGEIALEEVPEDLEPLEEETGTGAAAKPAPSPKPGLIPLSDSEPEPELEEPPVTEPPEKQAPPRSSEEVRKDLRNYLDGVKGKLEGPSAPPAGPAHLLDYLKKLSEYLPEREKKRFRGSSEHLAIEALKARLTGRKTLRQKIAEKFRSIVPRRKEPMTRSLVVDTFSYLKELAGWLPDREIGTAMKERLETIVARMGGRS